MQDILAARIDRLPPDEKDLLQTLAVIGRNLRWPGRKVIRNSDKTNWTRMLQALQLGGIHLRAASGR